MAGADAVADRSRGDRHRHLVVEGDESESVLWSQATDQRVERLERSQQASVSHRAAAVDHHLQGCGRALSQVIGGGRGELEKGVDRVLVLDRNQVEVKSCV